MSRRRGKNWPGLARLLRRLPSLRDLALRTRPSLEHEPWYALDPLTQISPEPASGYPLWSLGHRTLGSDYQGPCFVWDVDKTYLSTPFSSPKGMVRIPLEFGVDKREIAGMPAVLRGLRWGPGEHYEGRPLYFVTASPPQIRRSILRKMELDGVEYDGITFKDWMLALRKLTPWRLFEQVGFKLCALLSGRLDRPRATEYLFGDDVERDAEAYAVYASILDGSLSGAKLDLQLRRLGVHRADRRCIFQLLDRLPSNVGIVARAFVHLERGRDPDEFARLGSRVVPVRGAYQLALVLQDMGLLPDWAVEEAAAALDDEQRAQLLADARDRGLMGPDAPSPRPK